MADLEADGQGRLKEILTVSPRLMLPDPSTMIKIITDHKLCRYIFLFNYVAENAVNSRFRLLANFHATSICILHVVVPAPGILNKFNFAKFIKRLYFY